MSNWTTTCTYCNDEIEVEEPSDVTKLDGDPLHDDCVDAYHDEEWEPNLPTYVDYEIRNEPQGSVPSYIRDIFKPWRVVIGSANAPTEKSSNAVPREVWDLGHLTTVTFHIDEHWNVEPVAVNGKKVTNERFRKYEHEP